MFSKISSFLSQAATQLVGTASRHDELRERWKSITDLLTSENDAELSIAAEKISTHLQYVVDMVCEEEEERHGSMGPCMEFILQHKILDTLCTTGKSDYPTGMRRTVFQFFCVLLGRIQQPLLPHVAVHQPIIKLINTCGRSSSNPLAVDEVQFIRTLCLKLQGDPSLSNFFLEDGPDDSKEKKFILAETLMRISNSEDNMVCLKSFECLLLLVSLSDGMAVAALVSSQLPFLFASKLQQHSQLVPSSLHFSEILACKSGWGVNFASSTAVRDLSPSPQQPLLHVEALFSWLDYCEQVTAQASEPLSEAVCEAIRMLLLESSLLPKLEQLSEAEMALALAILTRSLQVISHRRLQQKFLVFVFERAHNQVVLCCNHINEDVSAASLLLLDTLLSIPHRSIFPFLFTLILPGLREAKELPLQDRAEGDDGQNRHDVLKTKVELTVQSFLSVVPLNLLSATEASGDTGMTHYLMEAHKQVSDCRSILSEWSLASVGEDASQPNQLLSPEDEQTSNSVSMDKEPILVKALLDRLEKMLDQSYELNLHLTSVLAHLASYSHPVIDSYLFNTQAGHQYQRTVYTVLKKVSNQLQSQAARSPGLQMNILEARRRLVGEETSDLLSMPNNELLEGAIVLEEFCKELAAILFVKGSNNILNH